MKTRSTTFLAIAIMITLLDAAQKQSTVAEDLPDVAICNLTIKTFKQIFSSHIARAHGLHIIRLKRKNNIKKKLRPLSKKKVLASEYFYTCINVQLFIFLPRFITWKLCPNRVLLFHKNPSC